MCYYLVQSFCPDISFFFTVENACCIFTTFHLLTKGDLCYFYFLSIRNRASMNKYLWSEMSSYLGICQRVLSEVMDLTLFLGHMVDLSGSPTLTSIMAEPVCNTQNSEWRFPFSTSSIAFVVDYIVDNHDSDLGKTNSQSCFGFHFPKC